MNTKFETNFVVIPIDASTLVSINFWRRIFSKMDLCAACTHRVFTESKSCEFAVTHKAEVTWLKPCYIGDIVFLRGDCELGKKSIVVNVTADPGKKEVAQL